MPIIMVSFSGFTQNYSVFMLSEGSAGKIGETTIPDAAENLIKFCENKKTNKVHIFGDKIFCEKMSQDIKEFGLKKYSKTIEVEIN